MNEPHPTPILITVEGGIIQDIDNIPPGLQVVVHDYDAEGCEGPTEIDDDGQHYIESIYFEAK